MAISFLHLRCAGRLRARIALALVVLRVLPHAFREVHLFGIVLLTPRAPFKIWIPAHAHFTPTLAAGNFASMLPL